MQRSNVLLPEPLAPIMLTTIPRSTSKDTPRRTSSGPNLLCTSTTRIVGLSRFVFMGSLRGTWDGQRLARVPMVSAKRSFAMGSAGAVNTTGRGGHGT